jgi:hypothetical protein
VAIVNRFMGHRTVHHGDGVTWLRQQQLAPTDAIVTSLPDGSELPQLRHDAWRQWFVQTATLVCASVHDAAVCIFYQTDIKRDGRWVDKAHLVHLAAEAAGAACMWHKIVCRVPPGTTTFGRPAYGHFMAFSRGLRLDRGRSTPDVLAELGAMTWSRAMPMTACVAACRFLLDATTCRVIVDPFCGHGTILAVANAHGLGAVGVEASAKRVRKARALTLSIDGAVADLDRT